MEKFYDFAIGSLMALVPVVDPPGLVPIFLALTAGASAEVRQKLSLKIALYAVGVLIMFLFIGSSILHFFGISLEVVKIAGGIVIFQTGWHSLNSDPKLTSDENQAAIAESVQHHDISFIPMTIPLSAGPGSIAVTLGLAAKAGQGLMEKTTIHLLADSLAIALVGLLIYLCLRSSTLVLKLLGETGIKAFTRILGLFILAIGVQLILDGLGDWVKYLILPE
jgi:multiple antibiotic resistance protein